MTPFGKLARSLRQERSLLLGDVAILMNCTPSFISQIESGGKRMPDGFADKMATALRLDETGKTQLQLAAEISAPSYTISVNKDASQLDRELAHNLETGFARLDEGRKRKLLEDLKGISGEKKSLL